MICYTNTDLFSSPMQTWVNPVNTVGAMGAGLAKEFKSRFPEMFQEYLQLCRSRKFKIGELHLYRDENKWILNLPTKKDWRDNSELNYIETSLKKFVESYKEMGIISVSFPKLGCGKGGLLWEEVQPKMVGILEEVDIPVLIHV